jgi:hypothetical protein
MKVKLNAGLQAKFLPDKAYAKSVVIHLAEMADKANVVKERWTKEVRGGH